MSEIPCPRTPTASDRNVSLDLPPPQEDAVSPVVNETNCFEVDLPASVRKWGNRIRPVRRLWPVPTTDHVVELRTMTTGKTGRNSGRVCCRCWNRPPPDGTNTPNLNNGKVPKLDNISFVHLVVYFTGSGWLPVAGLRILPFPINVILFRSLIVSVSDYSAYFPAITSR